MPDPALLAFGATAAVLTPVAALALGLLSARREAKFLAGEVNTWRRAYTAECRARLDTIDSVHAYRRLATSAAHRVDQMRSLLNNAHYRNPETGRLSPRGQFPEEIN